MRETIKPYTIEELVENFKELAKDLKISSKYTTNKPIPAIDYKGIDYHFLSENDIAIRERFNGIIEYEDGLEFFIECCLTMGASIAIYAYWKNTGEIPHGYRANDDLINFDFYHYPQLHEGFLRLAEILKIKSLFPDNKELPSISYNGLTERFKLMSELSAKEQLNFSENAFPLSLFINIILDFGISQFATRIFNEEKSLDTLRCGNLPLILVRNK